MTDKWIETKISELQMICPALCIFPSFVPIIDTSTQVLVVFVFLISADLGEESQLSHKDINQLTV